MTSITFYAHARDRLGVAIQISKRALGQKLKISLLTPHDEMSHKVSNLLWSDSSASFLPNCLGSSSLRGQTPIIIDHRPDLLRQAGVLINLTDEIPGCFSSFDRLIEIVNKDAKTQGPARERFRFYRDRGYSLETHQLDGL